MYPFPSILCQFLLKLAPSVTLAENLFKNRIVREIRGRLGEGGWGDFGYEVLRL